MLKFLIIEDGGVKSKFTEYILKNKFHNAYATGEINDSQIKIEYSVCHFVYENINVDFVMSYYHCDLHP